MPPALFGGCLGICGVGGAMQAASSVWQPFAAIGTGVVWFAFALVAFALVGFAARAVRDWPRLRAQLGNPLQLPFLAAGGMSIAYLAGLLDLLPYEARVLMWLGGIAMEFASAAGMILLALRRRWTPASTTPLAILPFAGFLLAPVGGIALGWPQLSALLYLVGAIGGLASTILVVRRLTTASISKAERPLLFILQTPPAIGYLGLAALGAPLLAGSTLMSVFMAGAICLGVLAPALTSLGRRMPLTLWGATFPNASLSKGLLIAGTAAQSSWMIVCGLVVLALAAAATLAAIRPTWRAFDDE